MPATSGSKLDTGFAAFISYAHRDARNARWLHRALETYRLPRSLAHEHGRARVGRVFIDRSELATSTNLSDRIGEALAGSANLIVICSPAARISRWVNEEVRRFRAMGRGDRIFCLIVDGDPARDDGDGCFPPALFEARGEARIEPLAADLRPGNDKATDAKLKLLAGLLDIPFDQLRRRETARRQRMLAVVGAVSFALLAMMAVLTTFALISRADALRQRDSAERTSSFLLDVFNQANPDTSVDQELTLRAAIDHATRRALNSPELAGDPDVKASLLVVLAHVYANLRALPEGRRLLNLAFKVPFHSPQVRLRALAASANLQLWESDYPGMKRSLNAAFALLNAHADLTPYRPQLLSYRAQLAQANGDSASAMRDFGELRRISLAASPPDQDNALLALLGEGVAAVDADMPDRGTPLLKRVIARREAMGQPLHPQVLTAINTLGAVEIKRGHPVEAERWFRRAEAQQRRVYGDASLDVALSRSNLGRALVEQRRFGEAAQVLEKVRATYLAQAGDDVDTLANLEDSLGLARGGLGQVAKARAAFAHGLAVARKHRMPKEVELLADRAELECRAGAPAAGLPLVAEARGALARFKLPDAWRGARVDAVEGGCLLAAGRAADARPLLAKAEGPVVARWSGDTLFGRSVREDARRAGIR